jgi:hypothetical protein
MLSVLDQCELLAVMDNRVQSDGKWIAYTSDRNGHCDLFRKPSDGSGVEELLLTDEQMTVATDWSRGGKTLLYLRGPTSFRSRSAIENSSPECHVQADQTPLSSRCTGIAQLFHNPTMSEPP